MDSQKTMSFRQLMELRKVDDDHFRSISPAWSPTTFNANSRRAFGGHVYAQAAWAASQTVERGLFIHEKNVTGHFLLPGDIHTPFEYHVKRVRDGGVYCLRTVEVYQHSQDAAPGEVPCFVSTISFKREERKDKIIDYGHQNAFPDHIQREYDVVLKGKRIEDHPSAPSGDAVWWSDERSEFLEEKAKSFPGCEMRKVDMRRYNGIAEKGGGPNGAGVSKWRQLTFYRMVMDRTPHKDEENLNLHACAHMYASDRNSLFMVLRALGFEENNAAMGSLAHTVLFHSQPSDFEMLDEAGKPKWFVSEAWTSNSGDNRICHNSRLWDFDRGKIFATTMQDGMMRLHANDKDSKL